MVSSERLFAFVGMSLLLIAVPGPSVLFIVGQALARGRRAALMTVAGNATGAYVFAAAVALGVGAVVERSVIVFTALKLAGAAYLVYLGVKAIRGRKGLGATFSGEASSHGSLRTLWDGFVVGVSNPKSIVFFAAVLPQFVDRDKGHVTVQMLLLGLIFVLIALAGDSVWGLAAGVTRDWFARSPHRLAAIGGAGGLMMIGLGVTVAATGRKE